MLHNYLILNVLKFSLKYLIQNHEITQPMENMKLLGWVLSTEQWRKDVDWGRKWKTQARTADPFATYWTLTFLQLLHRRTSDVLSKSTYQKVLSFASFKFFSVSTRNDLFDGPCTPSQHIHSHQGRPLADYTWSIYLSNKWWKRMENNFLHHDEGLVCTETLHTSAEALKLCRSYCFCLRL